MPPISRRQRLSRSANAVHRRNIKRLNTWKSSQAVLDQVYLGNNKGKVRSFEENRSAVASIRMMVNLYLRLLQENKIKLEDIKWSAIYDDVAINHHMKRSHVVSLAREFMATKQILVFGGDEKRGQGNQKYNNGRMILNREEMCSLIHEVDLKHALGMTITNQLMRNYVKEKYNVVMHRTTMLQYFKKTRTYYLVTCSLQEKKYRSIPP